MGVERSKVEPKSFNVERNLPERLDCVAVHQCAVLMGEADRGGERLDGADLVVGGLDGEQQRVVPKGRCKRIQIDHAVPLHRSDGELESTFRQMPARFEYGGVFNPERDDAPARLAALLGRGGDAQDGQIVALGGAAREDDLLGQCADRVGDLLARLFDVTGGASPGLVGARRVGEVMCHHSLHQGDDGGVAWGRGSVIKIDPRRWRRRVLRAAGGPLVGHDRGVDHR